MKIGICSKVMQDKGIIEVIKISALIGYQGIEIFGIEKHLPSNTTKIRIKEISRVLLDYGVEPIILDTYIGDFDVLSEEDCQKQYGLFKKYIDMAKVLNCDKIRVNPKFRGHAGYLKISEKEYKKFAFWVGKCADYAEGYGVKIAIEHNLHLMATVSQSIKGMGYINRENVGYNYEPGNIFRVDRENHGPEAVKTFGNRILNFQLKDVDPVTDNIALLLGEGNVDYPPIIAELRKIGYKGFASSECHRKPGKFMSSEEIAQHEYEAIRRLLINRALSK